jgi:hypothetical protein
MISWRERRRIREIEECRHKISARVLPTGPNARGWGARIWGGLNSPLFITILSSVVIGLGASALTDQQNCRAQVSQTSERYSRLSAEVHQREARFFDAVVNAHSDAELNQTLSLIGSTAPYRYLEFKDRTLAELEDEYRLLKSKLNPVRAIWGNFRWDSAVWSWSDDTETSEKWKKILITKDAQKEIDSAQALFQRLLDGASVDATSLRRSVAMLQEIRDFSRFEDVFLAAGGQCSLWQSAKTRIGI